MFAVQSLVGFIKFAWSRLTRGVSPRHTIQAAVGLLLILLPHLLKMTLHWSKLSHVSSCLGFVVTLSTNAKVVFLFKAVLDYWFPDRPEVVSGGSATAEQELRKIEDALNRNQRG
ncbi:MAG TPA: hypothetical protein VFB30_20525 [Spirochaetia bacterium]|nr:hypothetical protein [Spirochaetia bacterium]